MVSMCLQHNHSVDYTCVDSCIPKRSYITKIVKTYTCTCVRAIARIIVKPGQKKICNTFIGVYIINCKQIIKKSKEIAQFIGIYIRNS